MRSEVLVYYVRYELRRAAPALLTARSHPQWTPFHVQGSGPGADTQSRNGLNPEMGWLVGGMAPEGLTGSWSQNWERGWEMGTGSRRAGWRRRRMRTGLGWGLSLPAEAVPSSENKAMFMSTSRTRTYKVGCGVYAYSHTTGGGYASPRGGTEKSQ